MNITMNQILKEHLELVKLNSGTDAGVEMLELEMKPANFYAANTYMVALSHIAALEARLAEAEAIIKPFAVFFSHLERRMKGDEDGKYYEINSGGLPDAIITLGMTRRAAAFLKGGE